MLPPCFSPGYTNPRHSTSLQISRETGRLHDLVDRLLALDQVDEAVVAARGASDYDVIHLADLFVSHGQAALGEQLVRERAESSNDSRLTAWLKATTSRAVAYFCQP